MPTAFNTAPVIVTTCTQRKSAKATVAVANLLNGTPTIGALARRWSSAVSAAKLECEACTLYRGRTIVEADGVARQLGSDLYVISAGLGLIASLRRVPAYDCTVAPGSALGRFLTSRGWDASAWWNELTKRKPRPLARLVRRGPVLLALPASYLRLVRDDLASVPAAAATGLRIFTSPAGARVVPAHLYGCVLPYDERLESIPAYAGTQADFAQRALRHFVEVVNGTRLTRAAGRAAVSVSLASWPPRARPARIRLSDDDINRLMVEQWARHAGSSTRLLRYLRDEAQVSCEQKRFSKLWQTLAAERRV